MLLRIRGSQLRWFFTRVFRFSLRRVLWLAIFYTAFMYLWNTGIENISDSDMENVYEMDEDIETRVNQFYDTESQGDLDLAFEQVNDSKGVSEPGISRIECKRRSCFIRNLYILNGGELHLFSPYLKDGTIQLSRLWNTETILHENHTLFIHNSVPPSDLIVEKRDSVFIHNLARISTLYELIMTSIGVHLTWEYWGFGNIMDEIYLPTIKSNNDIKMTTISTALQKTIGSRVGVLERDLKNMVFGNAVIGVYGKYVVPRGLELDVPRLSTDLDKWYDGFKRVADMARRTRINEDGVTMEKRVCYMKNGMINEKDILSILQSQSDQFQLQILSPMIITESDVDGDFNSVLTKFSKCDVLVTTYATGIPSLPLLKPKTIILELITTPHNNLHDLAQTLQHSYLSLSTTSLSTNHLTTLLNIAINFNTKQFFLNMPWEQFNNQLIEFKSACAVASILNRVLVLPHIGYRTDPNEQWDFTFSIAKFTWKPFERYFDINSLGNLPCQFITFENFKSLHAVDTDFSLGVLRFNPVAKATSAQQLSDYYNGILHLPFKSIQPTERHYQLSKEMVLSNYGPSSRIFESGEKEARYLAMGAMFWFYDFGLFQPYPLVRYVNYMNVKVYRGIVSSMEFTSRVTRVVGDALSGLKGNIVAIHVRRGDYWNKCSKIKDKKLREHCFPTIEQIEGLVDSVMMEKKESSVLYIATNLGGDKKEFSGLRNKYRTLFFEDLFGDVGELQKELDSVDMALLDMELCSKAGMFIGNFYSSFSRTIFERRELAAKPFEMF